MTINRLCISLLIIAISVVACNSNKSENDMSKIDLESIDFDTPIDSLLTKSKFFYLPQSPIDYPLHYSFALDAFRYNDIIFDGQTDAEFYQGKPDAHGDVYTTDEIVNRIDIYPSPIYGIDAIVLSINEMHKAEQLLNLLGISPDENFKTWSNASLGKSYLIKKESWMIDDTKMLTLTYCIMKSETDSLIQTIENYYK